MRAYFLVNRYLSGIQKGIQAGHCLAEMFMKYSPEDKESGLLGCWAADYKTMILLDGGNNQDLEDFSGFLHGYADLKYPIAQFREDKLSLNEAMTCVGIVVDEHVVDAVDSKLQNLSHWKMGLSVFEKELVVVLSERRLAS